MNILSLISQKRPEKNSKTYLIMNHYIIVILITCLPLFAKGQETAVTVTLDKGWKFTKAKEQNWRPATVPGTVHTDLLDNKQIPEPFYRKNEKELQWIDKEDWEYQTNFQVNDQTLSNEHIEFEFLGLDTYADVYLNGTKILEANNMFRRWNVEVKNHLKLGNNNLRVYFYSPISKILPVYNNLPYRVPASSNDQSDVKLSVFTRKAGYHYGWDWGPRFVTSGIWRPIQLKAWSNVKIEDLFIKQKSIDSKVANLEAQLEVNATVEGHKTIEIFVDNNKEPVVSKNIFLTKDISTVNVSFSINNPELWWPNGLGKQKLYRVKAVIMSGNQALSSKEVKRGLRTIEVVQEADDKGRSFYLKVNGAPVFMKGANYIPQDMFLPRVTKERYENLINIAVTSNMNMLRVWGGGIYENDIFYDLCDEKGILVWQDFMFACALYPPFEDLRQNIYEEAVDNVKRLRNHSSIAMWAGNNEIPSFASWGFWGFKTKWTPQDSTSIFNMYKDIFHHILPAALSSYDSEKFYWSASSNGENFGIKHAESLNKGDMHYWGVWAGTNKIESYNEMVPRFMSEYGFQSFPEMATIKKFALPADYDLNSEIMVFHQRSGTGNRKILDYMKDWFKVPADFQKFLYVSQLLQAEAIKIGMEAHRRGKPYCMGSLFWQIDDVWPGPSWSSMDYYYRWKAQQYYVKNAYKEIISSTISKGDSLKTYVISDRLKDAQVTLQIKLMDFNGRTLKEVSRSIMVGANASEAIFSVLESEFIKGQDSKSMVLQTKVIEGGKEIASNTYYFQKPKDLNLTKPAIEYTLTKSGATYTVNFKTNTLARHVRIAVGEENIIFSDNYFDLMPGDPKSITFNSKKALNKNSISVMSLFDSL